VRTWLFTSVTDDVLDISVKDEQSAHELWVRIASHFAANQTSRAIFLHNKFHSITQGTSSITEYCARKKMTANTLHAVGHPVQESDLVLNTLHGLNADFRTAADIIAFTEPLPSFSRTRNLLLTSEQSHNKGRPASSSSGSLFYAAPSSEALTHLPRRPMEVAVMASPVDRHQVVRRRQTALVGLPLPLACGSASA
jgi:hypothetical protein